MTRLPFDALLETIQKNQTFAIFGHINPDGDSIGAALAMRIILRKLGKSDIHVLSEDGVPGFLRFLPGSDSVQRQPDGFPAPDVAMLLDCGARKRAGEKLFPYLDTARFTVNIDHHVSNNGFCDLSLIDGDASSTCEVLFRFCEHAGVDIDTALAECLYTGVMYDTGRFKHSNTSPGVFEICSRLVALGAGPSRIASQVYDNRGFAHLGVFGYALSNIQTTPDRRIAWVVIPREKYRELGIRDEDTEGLVEQIGSYRECEAHIFFSQAEDGRSRVSMRSRGRINVNDICALHGGGGHRFAAGLRSTTTLDLLVPEVIAAIARALDAADAATP